MRALDVLAKCDAILAEDTRVTAKLLAIHGISRPLISYNDYNAPRIRPQVLMRLDQGERLVLVSDAGTPLVSDPGYKLVRDAIAAGARIHVLPGPSAVLSALVVSGLPTNRFFFIGFLPAARDSRRAALEPLRTVMSTLIFFEAPQRLAETLADLRSVLGPRDAAVGREITKFHEDIRRGNLLELESCYADFPVRGEITIVVGPPPREQPDFGKADQLLKKALPFMPLRAAVELVSEALNLPRKGIYVRALVHKQMQSDGA